MQLRRYPLRYDGAWHIDLGELGRRVGDRTRAVFVVSPNNPTGSYLKRDELEALSRLGLPIISDEVFAGYPLTDDPRRVASALEARDVLVLSLGGLSKLAALPQMKLAWAALGGPRALVDEALGRLELIADTYLSVGAAGAARPARAARHARIEPSRRSSRAVVTISRRCGAHSRAARRRCSMWRAAGMRWCGCPRPRARRAWVLALLEQHGVLVQPGWFYDFEQEPFVVVSLLTPAAEFGDGARRLADVRRSLSPGQLACKDTGVGSLAQPGTARHSPGLMACADSDRPASVR